MTEATATRFTAEELSTLERAIAERRSLGLSRLKPDLIDEALIQKMLEAANWGQSNGDTEPWRFIVFSGEGRNVLADAFEQAYLADIGSEPVNETAREGYRERASHAPLWIAIGVQPDPDAEPEEELMAVATAVQNLHLVASAIGLVGMWHSKGTSTHPKVAEALGFNAPARLLGLFFLGWPNVNWPEGERKPIEDKVTWAAGSR